MARTTFTTATPRATRAPSSPAAPWAFAACARAGLVAVLACSAPACTVDPEDGPIGQEGGEPIGGSVSCEGVCAHLVKVCSDEPPGCDAACGQWTEEVRGCTLDATDCATARACRENPDVTARDD